MKLICLKCNGKLKVAKHQGVGYPAYVCEECGQLYYMGDTKSKLIIKNGIKYLNLRLQ